MDVVKLGLQFAGRVSAFGHEPTIAVHNGMLNQPRKADVKALTKVGKNAAVHGK
jgi:hypothetical protein